MKRFHNIRASGSQIRVIRILVIFGFFLTGFQLPARAQGIHINASAPGVVSVGQQFRLVFEINTRDGKFSPPDLSDFDVLMGPSTSYSQSTQIINGRISSSVSYTYTYILQARKEGTFTIGQATLKLKKETIHSNALRIKVVAGQVQVRQQKRTAGTGTPKANTAPSPGENLFVKLIVNKTHVVQGEPVTATVKIYSRMNLSGFEEIDMPEFDGFLKQEIPTPQLQSLQREYINGQAYGTGVLGRYLLFPQKTGEVAIDPVKIICLVQQRVRSGPEGFFGDFFDSYRTVRQPIQSRSVKITVDPLPVGAPPGFKGAVGSFGLDVSADKSTLKVNDAVNLTVKISGTGNLKLIEPPSIDFPPDFEVYDPRITSNIKNGVTGATGYKKFEYLMIPRHAGNYRISPITFAYFDPQAKIYRTLRTPAVNLTVNKSNESGSVPVVSGVSREALKYLGKDIRYIHNKPFRLKPQDKTILNSFVFKLVWLILIVIYVLAYVIYRVRVKQRSDIVRLRNRKANRIARKRLKTAGYYLKKGEEGAFYEETLKAIWGYLSDKLGLPVSDLTREKAEKILQSYHVPADLIQQLIFVLDQCEFARYAPEGKKLQHDKLYRETLEIISNLEQKL
ncbi:MAG: protein BatD [Chlorobi bacterium]|nr:protein BatD [Chlorobiota bacterium]